MVYACVDEDAHTPTQMKEFRTYIGGNSFFCLFCALDSAVQIILRLSCSDLGTVNTSCCHALTVNYRYLRTGVGQGDSSVCSV